MIIREEVPIIWPLRAKYAACVKGMAMNRKAALSTAREVSALYTLPNQRDWPLSQILQDMATIAATQQEHQKARLLTQYAREELVAERHKSYLESFPVK